ncbi:MAG: type II toxin-antitoxin system VapB family antitoxin [Treponema sp.]|jgi:antitoxin VapB|nr:type II toxin-antitoxin system VapB family antitoxin [Treponema sp.]
MSQAVAKVFMNGRSQAIRLPKEFRFDTSEVYISKEDDRIILRPKSAQFGSRKEIEEFFASVHNPEFDLERDNTPPQVRELF